MKPGMFIGLALIAFGVGALVLQDLIYTKHKKIINSDIAKGVDPTETETGNES